MSRKGNGYDNAYVESFHSILKKKLIFHEPFTPRKKAKQRIFEYIEWSEFIPLLSTVSN
ncbi:transposase [Anoxybacillus flavithermus NBRC 109594]|uniref:Transposase n=2 Tax=Anoxybacillus flavithermus TaxID=33934 RepID=R4FAH2_9BACL|nr:transposase [Anoxybacillus flavithermus NBRC 109594]